MMILIFSTMAVVVMAITMNVQEDVPNIVEMRTGGCPKHCGDDFCFAVM
jgi:hypothetical protein